MPLKLTENSAAENQHDPVYEEHEVIAALVFVGKEINRTGITIDDVAIGYAVNLFAADRVNDERVQPLFVGREFVFQT